MKFSIDKNDIRNILGKVQGLTNRKSNLDITETVLIRTVDGAIKISATDLETGFEGVYPANVEAQGEIAINAKKLFEIVREFPEGKINIHEVENRWIEINNPSIEYHIVGMKPDEFPEITKVDDLPFFEIEDSALKYMIERTIYISPGQDEIRSHVQGVYFEDIREEDAKYISMASTDISRLSVVDYPHETEDVCFEKNLLIPKKGLNEVIKFLDGEGKVQIGALKKHFVVKKGRDTITIRLLEGGFPNYKILSEKKDGYDIELDREIFMMMLKRMSILSTREYKGAIFNFAGNMLVVRATNPDIGESREEMVIDFDGDPIEVAFNPKLFIDTLNFMEDDIVVLHITDKEKPCFIQGKDDKHFFSLIMPMKI